MHPLQPASCTATFVPLTRLEQLLKAALELAVIAGLLGDRLRRRLPRRLPRVCGPRLVLRKALLQGLELQLQQAPTLSTREHAPCSAGWRLAMLTADAAAPGKRKAGVPL